MLSWRDNRLSANGDTQARRMVFVAGLTEHFALSYDGLNRLTAVTGPVSESFVLDGASNITSRTGPSQTDSYDSANRLTSDGSQSFTWSNADRLATRGSDTFAYDALDRLTSSTVSGAARTYAYNGDGLLQSRTGAGATNFLWDPATSPSRLLKQGSDNIVYGLGPLYVVKADATTLTFARDGSKNVRAELSSTGAVTAALRYRAYGAVAQGTTAAPSYLGLASQLLDTSGLYFMRARWYDTGLGRFFTRDPQLADPEVPATLNLFYYAGADPIFLSDASGAAFKLPEDSACDESCKDPQPVYVNKCQLLPWLPDCQQRKRTTVVVEADDDLTTRATTCAASVGVSVCAFSVTKRQEQRINRRFTVIEQSENFLTWAGRNLKGNIWQVLSTKYRDASLTVREALEWAFEENDETALKVLFKNEYRR